MTSESRSVDLKLEACSVCTTTEKNTCFFVLLKGGVQIVRCEGKMKVKTKMKEAYSN